MQSIRTFVHTALLVVCILFATSIGAKSQMVQKFSIGGTSGLGRFSAPRGIAVGNDKTIFVCDHWNNRIQEFDVNGNYLRSFPVDNAYDITVSSDNRLVVLTGGDLLRVYSVTGVLLSSKTYPGKSLESITSVGTDLFITDTRTHTVLKISLLNLDVITSSFGGLGTASDKFNTPRGIAIGPDGNVYVGSGSGNNEGGKISVWTQSGSYIRKIQFPAYSAGDLTNLYDISFDTNNTFVVVTIDNVKRFTLDGSFVQSYCSSGSNAQQVNVPYGIVIVDSFIFVSDTSNDRIQKLSNAGTYVSDWGSKLSGPGALRGPRSVAVDNLGFMYVGDDNQVISKFEPNGKFVKSWGGSGTTQGLFRNPYSITFASNGLLYICDQGNYRIQVFTTDGAFVRAWGSSGTGDTQFQNPLGVATNGGSLVYVGEQSTQFVKVFDLNGNFIRKQSIVPVNLSYPYVHTVSADTNYLYVSTFPRGGLSGNTDDAVVQIFLHDGTHIRTIGSGFLNGPYGVVLDKKNRLHVADYGLSEVLVFDLDGNFAGRYGKSTSNLDLFKPMSLAMNGNGEVLVSDLGRNRVVVFTDMDVHAPVTAISSNPVSAINKWVNDSVVVRLNSQDGFLESGVKELVYSINDVTNKVLLSSVEFQLQLEGTYQLSYWSEDNAGNTETPKYATVKIDKQNPVTNHSANGVNTEVTLIPTDNLSGVGKTYYHLDSSPKREYGGVPLLLDGKPHKLVYWSVDNAGNTEDIHNVIIGQFTDVKSITLDRTTAVGGYTRMGRINLIGPAPSGGVDVLVWSDNSAATVPVSVTIPAGQSSATFEITTQPVAENTTVTLSATAGDSTRYAQFNLIPPSARISATPRTVIGGAVVTLAVTLDGPAPAGGTIVSLSSDNAAILPVPANVTVLEGQFSASVEVTSVPTQERSTVVVIASTAAQSAMTTVLVDAPSPVNISLIPTSVNGGTGSVGTVNINGTAPVGGYEVALTSNSASATVPASIVVAAGQTTGTFDIATRGVQQNTTVSITATANNVRRVAVLTVRSAAVASIQVIPGTVLGSQNAVGRVNLTTPAPDGGLVVELTSSNTNVLVPATVRVAAGETSTTFDVQTKSVTSQTVATITATFNGASKTATLTVNALVLQNMTVSAASVTGGTGLTATVTLSAPAPTGGVVVALSSNNVAVTIPVTLNVAAGQTTATVDITTVAVTTNTNVTLTATLLSVSKTASVVITAPGLVRLTLNPSSVVGGNVTTAMVDIPSPAPAGGLVVALSSNRTDVLAPATVTVPAGQTSVSVQVPTRTVLSQVTALVTATLNGVSRTANLSLSAPALTTIVLNPSTIRGAEDTLLTVNLSSPAPAGGVAVTLTSTNTAMVVPSTVTVPAGDTTIKVTLSTRAVSITENGQLTATFAGISKSVQVSVLAPVMATLIVEPNAVVGGSSAMGTLELSSVAPVGGLAVSLTSSISDVGVPLSVTVPAGSTSVTFVIQTTKVTDDVTAVITASLNGNTRASQIRVVAHQLATVAITPSSVSGGSSYTGRVTLQQAAPAGGIVVSLTSSDSSVSVPSSVTIDAGKSTVTFSGSTTAVTSTKVVTVTATLNGNNVTDTLRVQQPGIKAISLSANSVTGGVGSQLTLTLDAPAPVGGWVVNLASSDASATLATIATVPAGQTIVTVPVSTKPVLTRTAVALTATDASSSQSTTLVVEPVIGLQLRLSSSNIAGGNSVNLTVELAEAAPKTGATVALSADNAALIVPVSVKVLAGSKTATIAVKSLAVAVDTTVRIAGTVNGFTDRAQILVTAPRPQAVTFAPPAVLGGKPSTGSLTLTGPAPVGGLTVQLSSDNAAATVPATVLVPAGKNLVTFVVTTKAVASRTSVKISAVANGVTVTQQLAVQALAVQSVVMKPVTVVGGTPAVGTVTLNGVAPAGGLQVDLTSNVVGVTVPTKVFVPAGKNIVTFTATTEPVGSNLEVTLTARANGDQATSTLLVTPVLVSTLTVAPTTVVGGTSATGTVKLTVAPGIDTLVMLSSANPTIAAVPATVVVKKGTLTATFTVATKKPAAQTVVMLSAVTGGAAKIGKLTVKP